MQTTPLPLEPISRSASASAVIVPIVTPVTPDGKLDELAAARLVGHVAAGGCGLLVLGTTGEFASASGSLRRRFVELAVQAVDGRAPVFACVAHNALAESAALARDHLEAGADAVVGMLPNYFDLRPDEMRDYFRRLAEETPGPLYLYNMPATTRMSMPLEVIDDLSHLPNVVGLKDSEVDPSRLELLAERFAGRAGFRLYIGVAALAVQAFRRGFHGVVPSSGNLRPDLWRELHAAVAAGDWARAEALQQKTDALAAALARGRTLGESLAALKAALALRGLSGPEMLPPLRPLPAATAAALDVELAQFG